MTKPHIDAPSARTGLADPTDERSNCGVGAVVDLENGSSHRVVADSLELLENLEHRGTTGAEENTGDGAGILFQRPDAFFEAIVEGDVPDLYAAGSVFMPTDEDVRKRVSAVVEESLEDHGLSVFHWRDVPTDNSGLGATALESEPDVWQMLVEPTAEMDEDEFDRALYLGRRAAEKAVESLALAGAGRFYVCSLDRKTLVYKGLLTAEQLPAYYPDLQDERFETELALVHARFSTNTLGAWHLAHPYRQVIHNGEINTIRGNVNWMRARETDLQHEAFGGDIETLKPITKADQSDTASVDNVVELLLKSGRELPHVLRMLIPEAYRNDDAMDQSRRDWYDFHASLVEPWDGPALVAATDGDRIAAVLDRNGLRPCRYEVTTDGRLIVASEVGALDTDPAELETRGRLRPGEIFMADPEEGRVIPDAEVFDSLTDDKYGEWVSDQQRHLDEIADHTDTNARGNIKELRATQASFGYTHDQLNHMIEPMARDGKDPVGSMGDDTPISVLSDFNRPLFTYFKQLFAQVSNPPIDYIREKLVTSLESRLGFQRNLLDESEDHARQLVLDSPVLTDAQTAAIKEMDDDMRSTVVDITYERGEDLREAIEAVREEASTAIESGADIVVLSDRNVGPDRVAIPSLLATGAVHHSLVRNGLRNRAGLVVESGDPREVHHLATLVGYGAGAVNPYLAYQTIGDIVAGPDGADEAAAIEAYIHALEDGLLKTMAKMGISTVESYRGAQIFEAVGLSSDFVAEYFEGTEIRTEGIGLDVIETDLLTRHTAAFGGDPKLERQGEFENRSSGIRHGWNPQTVGTLQQAVRAGDYGKYKEFAELVNDQSEGLLTLRGLLEFAPDREPVDIDEVESVESIVKRFSTAAMSLGSLSPEAHENNSIAMNRIGGKSNSGEGGEPPERFGTEKECNVKQVASGRFGVTSQYLSSADEIQIKMAQGSKPGEGGHLPGKKVNEMIAHVRYATPGVGLISPPPLHDIYSIEDLKQLIFDLKSANPDADINVKLVSEAGIGTIAAGVSKAKADVVHISGHDGGTGASPKTSIKNAGLPWELGLAEANQMLRATGLRSRIRVSVDGGMKTGRDVAIAALLGGEEYVFGTAPLVTSGCVMARQCQDNTCPVGVATQDENLRNRFPGEPDHVINYMTFIAEELREIMAELGFTSLDEMIGRPSLLRQIETDHEKAKHLDLSAVLAEPESGARRKTEDQVHADVDTHVDHKLIDEASGAIENREPVVIHRELSNVDRAVGAMLSNRISNEYGVDGLPDDTIRCEFSGIAGQTFGGFLADGVTMRLNGAANDYVGKGLSGGRVVVQTPAEANYAAAENILIGNVALYGATQGEAYINGLAGERFAVRNSGVKAVVEGVGDHGCEYMTGGVVAVLGDTGRNFAAGMSGGVAYVYDPDDELAAKTNTGMVTLEDSLGEADAAMLTRLVQNHLEYTDSDRAAELLDDWQHALSDFVKVMPEAYAEIIAEDPKQDVRSKLPPKAGVIAGASADNVGAATTSDD
ncbi:MULTISPECIES: glutamate synthase large subunit [Haloferax]|uniref:Glutamate synthase large subunit n=1 Tax=Haloferax marinum TaxID=2666143 RepID=A0A6A8G703_9EURY|nr:MULTISPECIES: glutamate synthase large subunit [Haloferax]KAB1196898.1 glutamate synthase large subunit [Haloferax sp. CBA1150]MRW95916.1 glutamate synthase large subunit [Haloferax marinum]